MRWQSSTLIRGADNEPLRDVSVFHAVTERWQQNEHTRHLAPHDVGDVVLKLVAGKLQALVRKTGTVSRVGGDAFVILLDNPAGQDKVAHVARRIIEMLDEPMEIRGQVARIGTSVGMAMHPADGRSAARLITNADTAMYGAESAGRNTHRFFAALPPSGK